jgi:uncharacterized protein (DUF302 family)
MRSFLYTVETQKSFNDDVRAVQVRPAENGFHVLHTHDVAGDLNKKGFPCDPPKIVEICSARYANEVIQQNIGAALMLPCPITVDARDGKTFISALLPTSMAEFLPQAAIQSVAETVERLVRKIVGEAKG